MNVAIVIPARYASARLPAKPLLRETGKYLIEHVYELALKAKCTKTVIVATDDQRILDAVLSFGGNAVMTRADHPSGTDRIAEVARNSDAEIIVNLQGDEPQFDPAALDLLAELLIRNPNVGMATLATPLHDKAAYLNSNIVKVICDDSGRAMYFSRSPIPMVRDGEPNFNSSPPLFLQHLGVYAYRRDILLKLASLPAHPIELTEKLEQLRALAHGIGIQVGVIPHAHRGVDTPEDYAAFVDAFRNPKL
jgi:3-deoxy-manno-octulosonate cytidylyltransferase (CMP-KDO synthetase)